MDRQACIQDAHCALFYADAQVRLDGIARFLAPALRAGDPVALSAPAATAGPLIGCLDALGCGYELLDRERNPARIIPAVAALLGRGDSRTLYYVDEPIWPGRPRDEAREATRHEALVNVAWPGAAIKVLCLYDETELEPELLALAEETHPWMIRQGCRQASRSYTRPDGQLPSEELEPAPSWALALCFQREHLAGLRRMVREWGERCGLPRDRAEDLVLAVDELATNTIKHADGRGRLSVWHEPGRIVCQVEDPGHIGDPLAGRRRPRTSDGGVGLWAVNQLCDLVQLRSDPDGTVVRVHMALR